MLDSATGRLIRRYRQAGNKGDLYWLGGENPQAADMLLVEVDFGCYSSGCEYGILTLGVEREDGFNADVGGIAAALNGALVFEGGGLHVFGRKGFQVHIPLRRIPTDAPHRVVADVAHNRLFVVSSAGMVAEIRDPVRRPRVTYHPVDLNGRPFEAAWAGADKIALWGADGLGTIDTRTWKTQAITSAFPEVVTTPFGIAVRSSEPSDGVAVYRPDGRMRFRVLVGRPIVGLQAVGEYLYASAAPARFSINLRTGEVVGPLYSGARIIAPTLVPIP